MSGAAVVTGAGSGLGREIARRLDALGYAVCVADIDADSAAATAELLSSRAWAAVMDVADPRTCSEVAHLAARRGGGLDVWVNNAGILRTGPAWDLDQGSRERLMAINAHGTINGTLGALEVMRHAGVGHVINIASLAGLIAPPGEALYAASKHAALAFSVGTLADLRVAGYRHIHISSLCPDGIWTPMLFSKVDDPAAAASWSGTLLEPGDVADAAVGLIARPRPIRSIPRRRGLAVRLGDALPRLAVAMAPRIMAQSRRRQRAFASQHPQETPDAPVRADTTDAAAHLTSV